MKLIRYISSFMDRHGRKRWRFRRGKMTVAMPEPTAPDFQRRYQLALNKYLRGPVSPPTQRQVAALHYLCERAIDKAKQRARRQFTAFDIDKQTVSQIMEKQEWKCAVSGILFSTEKPRSDVDFAFRPSIDRIEPRSGYTAGNVRIVCEIVTLAMNRWGEKPLKLLAQAMANQADG